MEQICFNHREVPVPPKVQENFQDNAGCGELVSVGEPETHQKANSITGKSGMWFQDPENPGAPYGPDTVWRINTVSSEVRELYAYENLEQLARGYPTKVLLFPESMESTGATVFHGSLYYQRRQSPTLLRYDLAAGNIVARRELPDPGFHGQYPYSWGGYTDINLAVDEKGLWAIYSTENARGAIIISHGQSKAVDVPFHNRYGYNSMIDYNAARKKLYSWDNFHMVTYDVKLTKTSSSP
ncbi:myocilin-like isoform X1 [Tachysurus ichikawai]